MAKDNNENISKFLNNYEQTELSNVRLGKYINKKKREFTSQELLLVISARGLKHFTCGMLRKRNLLKCVELMKVTKSKESKASAEDTYKPKLDWMTEDYACLMLL